MWRRLYATTLASGRNSINHSHYNLHPWPNSVNPSPYEIFDTSKIPSSDLKKHIRLTYKKYVKLYHPDLAASNDILDNDGQVLLKEQKRARFNEIRDAYEHLCDPLKPAIMRRYNQGTSSSGPGSGPSAPYNSPFGKGNGSASEWPFTSKANRQQFYNDLEFWRAGTWEEYYRMKYNKEPPTREQIEANKWKIFRWVVAFTVVYSALQFLLAMERANEYNRQARLRTLKADSHLAKSYGNYGDDDLTQLGRIKRFLVHRNLSLLEEDRKKVNEEMLMKYAQRSYSGKFSEFSELSQDKSGNLLPENSESFELQLLPPPEEKW